MRGMLSFLILFIISKKPMHGQEIAEELERRRGERPSPGTIYPALKCLREEGFIEENSHGKTIIYKLTKEGKEALNIAQAKFARSFGDLL